MTAVVSCSELRKTLLDFTGPVDALPLESREHLGECTTCREFQQRLAGWDARIALSMSEIPIPATAQNQCLETLAQLAAREAFPRSATAFPWRRTLALMAAMLLLAVGFWWPTSTPERWSVEQVAGSWQIPQSTADDASDPEVEGFPESWDDPTAFVVLLSSPRELQHEQQCFAVTQVEFRVSLPRSRRQISGWLVSCPLNRIAASDALADSFFAAESHYQGGHVWAAWRESGRAFVCFVPTGPEDFDRLKTRLRPHRPVL